MYLSRVLIVALCFLFLPAAVSAHGDGASFERTVNGTMVDIGYSPTEITAGAPVPFDFALADAETGEDIAYSDVWVRIHRDRDVSFASGIRRSPVGATTMLFQFPEAGTYTLSVRFQNDGEPIAETSFEVPVAPADHAATVGDSSGENWLAILGALLLGVVLGGAVAQALYRRKKH